MQTITRSQRPPVKPPAPRPSGEDPPAGVLRMSWQRALLGCGVAGPLLFTGTYVIDGFARPGYDGWREPISALGLGAGGWVQSANFLVFGLLSLCFTVGLRRALAPGTAATWGPLLRVAGALGLIFDGAFAAGPLHQLGDALTFTALPLACFVLARRFAGEPGWRGWAAYSVASGVGFWALLAAFTATNVGLFEKLAAGVMSVWLLLLAVRLMTGTGHVSPQP